MNDGEVATKQTAARLKVYAATRLERRPDVGIGGHKAEKGVRKRCNSDARPSGAKGGGPRKVK